MTNTSEGGQLTSEGAQPTSESVHPPKKTVAETWYAQPREKRNNRKTDKRYPIRSSPRLHSIQLDNSPEVSEEEKKLEVIQTPTQTQTPQQPMIIEEDPAVPAPTLTTSASFQIPRMISQEALQAVTFEVMTH